MKLLCGFQSELCIASLTAILISACGFKAEVSSPDTRLYSSSMAYRIRTIRVLPLHDNFPKELQGGFLSRVRTAENCCINGRETMNPAVVS
jgi:hypothetical protein